MEGRNLKRIHHYSRIRPIILLAVIALLATVAVCIFAPQTAKQATDKPVPLGKKVYKGGQITYAQSDEGHGDGSQSDMRSTISDKLFQFNPNTADSTTLLRLGLRPWQVRAIYRYRAKGGRYYNKEGFAKTPGLTLADYRKLEPYIVIPQQVMAADVVRNEGKHTSVNALASETAAEATPRKHYITQDKIKPGETIDINSADTTQLQRIPGIGPYFARRIVRLRNYKRIFFSPTELLEIDDFPEGSLQYMTAEVNVEPIRINTMTLDELKSHPLLKSYQAREIERLRRTQGKLHRIEDMAFLKTLSKEDLKRIAPYIIF